MSARFTLARTGPEFVFTLQLEGHHEALLSSERYAKKASAVAGIEAVKSNAPIDDRYQRRTSLGHEPYFVLRGLHDEVLGTSDMFSSVDARNRAIAAVKEYAAVAVVFDET